MDNDEDRRHLKKLERLGYLSLTNQNCFEVTILLEPVDNKINCSSYQNQMKYFLLNLTEVHIDYWQ